MSTAYEPGSTTPEDDRPVPFRSMAGPRLAWGLLGVALLVVAWLEGYFFRHELVLGIVLVVVAAVVLAATTLLPRESRGRLIARIIGGLVIVAEVFWFISGWYPAWVIAQTAAIVLALVGFGIVWSLRRRKLTVVRGAARILGAAGVLVAVLISALVVVTSITPVPITEAIQHAQGFGNSYKPAAATKRTVVQDNTLLINDLRYGTKYPNSYLDIYIADNNPNVSRPTLIYVHGGGWIIGNKTMGDPNAGTGDFALSNGPVINAGYNVVTLDYALAPEYSYPTPVIQLSEAVTFLKQHGSEYGLDMSRVVLGGGSAGGHIAAQYAEIQTNPALSTAMGITPTLDASALKALTLDSAALDGSRASRTQAPDSGNDFQFGMAGKAYFGIHGFMSSDHASVDQANIITHATSEMPPVFIADGNYGTFPDQARDLSKKLTKLGVKNELNLYPLSDAKLGHGYMARTPSKYVTDYNEKKIAFLNDVVK